MGRYAERGRPGVRGPLAAALAVLVLVLVAGLIAGAAPARSAPVAPAGTTTAPAPTDTVTATPTETPTGTPTPTPTPTVTPPPADDLLRPDLQALPASHPVIRVRADGWRLRFTTSLANLGVGPMEIRPNQAHPCPPGQHNATQAIYRDLNHNGRYNRRIDTEVKRHRAGCMVFHPRHDHWHFKATARYALVDPSQPGRVVVSARRKVSFCLRDSDPVPELYGLWPYREAYGECARRTPQGISIGWMDVYQRFLAGQFLQLPAQLTPGLYCLVTVVDPLNQVIETNDANNRSVLALSIGGPQVAAADAAGCQ